MIGPGAPTYVIGVDPGKSTGLSAYDVRLGQFIGGSELEIPLVYDFLLSWARADAHVLFACERFVITQSTARKSADAHWPMKMWGVVEFVAWLHNQSFVAQTASDAKNFAPDPLLRDVNWYTPGKGHQNDATRHVVLALANELRIAPPWASLRDALPELGSRLDAGDG